MPFHPQALIQRIETHATTRADTIAAYSGDRQLTYGQLQTSSAALAEQLQNNGVQPGSILGVCVRPGFDLLIAIIAIFRCRGVYLPLDPDHPQAHIDRIRTEAQPRLILTHREHLGQSLASDHLCYLLDEERMAASQSDTSPLPPDWQDIPAYLMYTSGTTGRPKGVLISQDNLHHYLAAAQTAFRFNADDIFCNVARATFSISLFDLLLPLAVGAAVRLVNRADIFNLPRLVEHLERSTVFHAGPSLLSTLFRYLRSVDANWDLSPMRHVSSGGDIVLPTVIENMKIFFPKAELFVIYGTTEISCMGTLLPIERHQLVTKTLVGKPFPGVGLKLIDGEICFSGPGVGLGYWHQTAETSERFIAAEDGLCYRTGDYGRWHEDGNLEMLGRRDFQVQLRGVRLELTAIENCILESGLATHAVVVHRRQGEDSGFLIAFLAGASEHDIERVRSHLQQQLPMEMLPQRIIVLETMPTNFNGKLDRRRLMEWPLENEPTRPAELNALGQTITAVLAESLESDNFSCDQNFFEAGGHSLLAIFALSTLSEKHGIVIPPAIFFQEPTARALANYWQSRPESTTARACHLVRLNEAPPRTPIFFMAGVHIYQPLARALPPEWTALALISEHECQPSDPSGPPTLEALAEIYKRSILEQQPQGPYYLLGYSFAGILAFEVARQLTDAGHEVKRLFLLDATLPEHVFRWKHGWMKTLRVLRMRPRDFLLYLRGKWRPRAQASDPRIGALDKARGHRNGLHAQDYMRRMRRYPGAAVLFVADESLKRKPLRSRTCGWRPYISNLKVIRTAGDHLSLIQDPISLEQIVKEIHACAGPQSVT